MKLKIFIIAVFVLLITIPIQSIAQCGIDNFFEADTTENCVQWEQNEKQISIPFSTPEHSDIESIEWNWGDGTSTLSSPPEFKINKTYQLSGIYTVNMVRTFSNGCVDEYQEPINIYDNPSIGAFRLESSPSCAPAVERVVLRIEPPISPQTEIAWNFGDRTPIERWRYDQPYSETNKRNGDTIKHIYQYSSCHRNFNIQGEQICQNCFGIVVTARNHCPNSMAVFAIAPIFVYGKPEADFAFQTDSLIKTVLDVDEEDLPPDTLYQLCSTGLVDFVNLGGVGKGKNCQPPDTISWLIRNHENNEIDSLGSVCEHLGCDSVFEYEFLKRGNYSVTMQQRNSCGDSTQTKDLLIRQRPHLSFDFGGTIECYPAVVNFVNKSDTLDQYEWFFDLTEASTTVETYDVDPKLYKDEGEYNLWVKGYDDFCENRFDTTLVLNRLCEDLYVPNAFLPESSDERFRTFRPVAANLVTYSLKIFNIRGELLWESDKIVNGYPKTGWDGKFKGKECPAGTYMWKIDATFRDGMGYLREWKGQKEEKGKRKRVGKLTLIR